MTEGRGNHAGGCGNDVGAARTTGVLVGEYAPRYWSDSYDVVMDDIERIGGFGCDPGKDR